VSQRYAAEHCESLRDSPRAEHARASSSPRNSGMATRHAGMHLSWVPTEFSSLVDAGRQEKTFAIESPRQRRKSGSEGQQLWSWDKLGTEGHGFLLCWKIGKWFRHLIGAWFFGFYQKMVLEMCYGYCWRCFRGVDLSVCCAVVLFLSFV